MTIATMSSVQAQSVVGVGLNNFTQTAIPSTLGGNAALVAGREYSMALKPDGTVIGWGRSGEGRSQAPDTTPKILALSAGIYHSLGLTRAGEVCGWGLNGNGILSIPNDLGRAFAVAAGGYHSLALRRDGTVAGWGFAGDRRTTPPATLVDVIAIDAGRDHSIALKSGGGVVAWGVNDKGQCDVPAGLSSVIAIAAGENHSLALREDGTVAAWGANSAGQCNIPAGMVGVVAVSAGAEHSLALLVDGTVRAWGDNSKGQLNIAGADCTGIAAGGYHSLVAKGGPLITRQPLGKSVRAGSAVTLRAEVAGEGSSFQWQLNGNDIAGAVSDHLSIDKVTPSSEGLYSVKITNDKGTAISSSASLVVRPKFKAALPQDVGGGRMRLRFMDESGVQAGLADLARHKVEASEDLQHWEVMKWPAYLSAGHLCLDDLDAAIHARRFYRLAEKF